MKIIHAADLHIGSQFLSIRDEEVRLKLIASLNNSFKRLVDYAIKENIDKVLLSGDIFDKDKVLKRDKDFFYSIIKGNPNIDFYYLKGNHDINDTYKEEILNLHTFNNKTPITYKSENVSISGFEIDGDINNLYDMISFDKENYNILMLHGDINNDIDLSKIYGKNINYLALGHIHKKMSGEYRGMKYNYPGCMIGRGFDEVGDRGFLVLDTLLNKTTFIKNDFYSFERSMVNISNIDNNYSLMKKLDEIPKDLNVVLQIVLKGEALFKIDVSQIKNHLNSFLYVQVKDDTILNNLDLNTDSNTLLGVFIGMVNDSNLSENEKQNVLKYGIDKIKGAVEV